MNAPSGFRDLTADEVDAFRDWADENYAPHGPINDLWHPVVRERCEAINDEAVARWEADTERANR